MARGFILDNIFSALSVYIAKAYHIQHTIGWQENKTRNGFVLWIVDDGVIHLTIEGKKHTLKKGDAVLFYPNDTYTATTDESCKYLYVYFSLEMGGISLLSDINLAGTVSHKYIAKQSAELSRCFADNRSNQHRPLKMHVQFLTYIANMIDLLRSGKGTLFYDVAPTRDNNVIQTALKHIKMNYNKISVKELALLLNMGEKNFISTFKKSVGITPWQYILQCRMEKATQLLSEKDMKMSVIAKRVGYADQYIFSKSFKKFFGIPPLEYKKNVLLQKSDEQ